MDPTHEQQTKTLLKAVRSRMQLLAEQQLALTQTLAELKEIEQLAITALQTMGASLAANAKPHVESTGRST